MVRRAVACEAALEALEGRRLLSAGDPDLAFGADAATAYFGTYLSDLVAMDSRGGVSAVAVKSQGSSVVFRFDAAGQTLADDGKVELYY